MSLQFLTRPPFTDIARFKDDARKSAKSSGAKLAKELEAAAHSATGGSWQNLLRSHVATLHDGSVYITVDDLPVRITSLYSDDDGNPIAVGDRFSLNTEIEFPSEDHPEDRPEVPGLLITYDPDPEAGTFTLEVTNPTRLDGKIVPASSNGSKRIPLRERLGPIVEVARHWVSEMHAAPIPDPTSLPEAEIEHMVRLEALRMRDHDQSEFSFDVIDFAEMHATPQQAALLGRWMTKSFPMFSEAYMMIAGDPDASLEERIAVMGIAATLQKLHIDCRLDPDDIHWWSDLDTRPYMRARGQLASFLVEAGRTREAIETYRDPLELNPNDNQGSRFPYLGLLLSEGSDESRQAAHAVLSQYDSAHDAQLAYGKALLAFQKGGDTAEARRARAAAHSLNNHIPGVLSLRRELNMPRSYGAGSIEEAVVFLSFFRDAFEATPGAIGWIDGA